jgi:hypothetical protein
MNQPKPSMEVVKQIDPGADIRAELSRLRLKREELAAARLARAEAAEPAAQVAAEALALRNEEAIEAAEQEHGPQDKRIRVVNTDLGVVIVKRAHPNVFKRFMDQGKHNVKECEALCRTCLVYPSLSEFEAMCSELPMLPVFAANAVAYLAGVRAEDLSAK